MLKLRVLTALVLVPLVVAGILMLSTLHLAAVLSIFVLLGAWEWAALIGFSSQRQRFFFVVLIALVMLYFAQGFAPPTLLDATLFMSVAWWLMGFSILARYRGEQGIQASMRWVNAFIGVLLLVSTWLAIAMLHGVAYIGPALVLYLMILVWGADTGAYFVGRRFGKRKLAPLVSPGKTLEGVIGGFATCGLIAVAGANYFQLQDLQFHAFILISLLTAIFSVEGDLMESLYKRRAGVKDSGALLPGHGGVLDRIDSLTAAAPVFAVGFGVLERLG